MVGVLAQKYFKKKKAELAKAAKQAKLKEKDLDCSKNEQRRENGKD